MKKRILSLVLCVCMVASLFSGLTVSVSATVVEPEWNVSARLAPSLTEEIPAANNAKATVTMEGDVITVTAPLAELEASMSSDPGQQDKEHKWIGLGINTGIADLTKVTYQGSYTFTADDVAEAQSVGLDQDGEFVLLIRADELAVTPRTITLSADGYPTKYITIKVAEPAVTAAEVATPSELDAALASASEITLTADIDYADVLTIPAGVKVDLNGYNLYVTGLINEGTLTKNGGKLWANVSEAESLTEAPTAAELGNLWAAAEELNGDGTELDGIRLIDSVSAAGYTYAGTDLESSTAWQQENLPNLYAADAFSTLVRYGIIKIPAGKTLDLNGYKLTVRAIKPTLGEGTILANGGSVTAWFNTASTSAASLQSAVALAENHPAVVTELMQTSGSIQYTNYPIPAGVTLKRNNAGSAVGTVTFLVAEEADFTRAGAEYATAFRLVDHVVLTGDCDLGSADLDYNGYMLLGGRVTTTGTVTNKPFYYIAAGECGANVQWALDSDGLLTIYGTDEMHWEMPTEDPSVMSGTGGSGTPTGAYVIEIVNVAPWYDYNEFILSAKIVGSVTNIAENAFYECAKLSEITIPASVTVIEDWAFYGCTALTSIEIPDSVTNIENYAFYGCTALSDVYYDGTQAQWDAITIGSNNECLTGATLHGAEPVVTVVANGECGSNLTWTLEDNGILTISGTGAMSTFSSGATPWYNYREQIQTVVIEEGVTSISDYAFESCTALTEIVIPNGLTGIGSYAFRYCAELTEITIPNSVKSIGGSAFYRCISLETVALSKAVKNIWNNTFGACASLTDIYYGGTEAQWNDVSIGTGNNMLLLASVHFNAPEMIASGTCGDNLTWTLNEDGLLTISGTGKMWDFITSAVPWNDHLGIIKTVVIGDGATDIGACAFRDCTKLSSVEIPDSVTIIDNHAFSGCRSLKNITLPANLTMLWHYVFSDCSALQSIEIPASVTSIGGEVFSGCSSLVSVTIPEGVKSIGTWTFSDCKKLSEITIPSTVTYIENYLFCGCTALKDVTLSEGVTGIGTCAFAHCTALTEITLPASLMGIGNQAFQNCTALQSVTLPDGAWYISEYAFSGDSALKSITIPKSVTHISTSAFSNCTALKDVYYGGTQDEWDAIKIGGGNEPLTTANIHVHVHSWDGFVTIEPTCTEPGEIVYTCTVCDENKTEVLPALGHDLVHHEGKAPTCTEIGWDAYDTCIHCDYTTYMEIVALRHNYAATVTAPTCTEQGYTTHTCRNCGDSYVDSFVSPAGHDWSDGVWTTVPSCAAAGEVSYVCSVCGETRTEVIPALGHSCVATETAPTCTEQGYTTHQCTRCDYNYVDSVVPSIGHGFTNYISNNDATCAEDGTKTAYCDHGCGATDTVTDVDSHLNVPHTSDGNVDCTKATYCTVCGTILKVAGSHSWDNGVVTKEPTCAEKGEKLFTCTVCGATKTSVLAARGHVYDGDEDLICNVCGFERTPPVYVFGDINGDGAINTVDANMALMHYVDAAHNPLTTLQRFAADVDGNGAVNTVDANMILLHYVGIEELQPITYTLVFDANGTSEYPATVSESSVTVMREQSVGNLPTPTRDYYTFDGWYTAKNGGEKVTADTNTTTLYNAGNDVTLYAHWTLNESTGWVLASEVPADAQVLNEKWAYTKTSNMESTSSTASGWTPTGSYWSKTGSGSQNYATFPSGFDTSHTLYQTMGQLPYASYSTENTKRVVSRSFAGYVYYHWMYNVAYSNSTKRAISSKRMVSSENNYAYYYFYAFTSSVDCPYLDKLYCNSQGIASYYCHDVLPETSSIGIGTPRFFRFEYYTSSYEDFRKIYQYQKVENLESTTEVKSGIGISDVRHYVQYRAK